ncbi:MAG: hypothetical protein AAGH19_02820 [Pseudomonadota bacterium]
MSPYRIKGTAGALLNQSFPLAGELRLGTGPDFDVTVEPERDQAAEGDLLAVLRVLDDGAVQLEATRAGAVAVNGDDVTMLQLAGGDELRVGRSRFILQAPGLRPERVLTDEATRARSAQWPWWLAAAMLLGAGAGVAWWQGWLPFGSL